MLGTLLIASFKAAGETTQARLFIFQDVSRNETTMLKKQAFVGQNIAKTDSSADIIYRLLMPRTERSFAQVSFRGDGPLGGLQAIAEATGQVKGSVGNAAADPPLQPNGKLDVGSAVGQGMSNMLPHAGWKPLRLMT